MSGFLSSTTIVPVELDTGKKRSVISKSSIGIAIPQRTATNDNPILRRLGGMAFLVLSMGARMYALGAYPVSVGFAVGARIRVI